MRPFIPLLPAFLALLLPLAALAVVGSRELARLQGQAETLLRDRAFDLVSGAAEEVDRRLAATVEPLLDVVQRPELDVEALRAEQPALLEKLVVDDFDVRRPSSGPPWQVDRALRLVEDEVRTARLLHAVGDLSGAIALLAGAAADGGGRADLDVASYRIGLLRAAGRTEEALEEARSLARTIALEAAEVEDDRRRGSFMRRLELAAAGLLTELAVAELRHELSGDATPVLDLLRRLGSDHDAVQDAVLVAVRDECTQRLLHAGVAQRTVSQAGGGLERTLAARRVARVVEDELRRRRRELRRDRASGEPLRFVFEMPEATCLAVLRPTTEEDGDRVHVGVALDLSGMLQRILAPQLEPRPDGFHLEILTAEGERVLRHPGPDGTAGSGQEVFARSEYTGLQFKAVPRNAREQLDARRAAGRNRALLILALCLVAAGGAFFLVRSVGREAELAALKVDLVSRVSHELRTPLAMIKMYGETLALGRAKGPEQTTRFAGIVSREADRLTLLIDRILDFSRQVSRSDPYQREEVDLAVVVEEVAEGYRPHVEAAGAALEIRIEGPLPGYVDRSGIQSAVINLLENAVKYTDPGSSDRRVELELRRHGDRAELDVMDRGVGVPAAERSKVFTSFYRASTAGQVRGAGLGLAMVHHFVTRHGGDVEMLERPGGGSIVRMKLPLQQEEDVGESP